MAMLDIGVRQVSGTKEVEKLSPQTGGKVIYFFYPGCKMHYSSNGWFLVIHSAVAALCSR